VLVTQPTPTRLYLDLLKKALTRIAFEDEAILPEDRTRRHVPFRKRRHVPLEVERRAEGRDWPVHAETMIGLARLEQVEAAVETVIGENIPGDLIETGAWRGGACIFMRAILAAHGDTSRTVWVADSFQGLPAPDADAYPADAGGSLHEIDHLAVSVEQVQANFRRYGLLDEQVRFLPGWFRDTLPAAPMERLAVLRLDGDLYESTMLALDSLYPKVSPGGYVIVDDYSLTTCRAAVDDFRAARAISEPLVQVDWTGVHWRRAL
jgi:O-methyltransferase